MALPSVTVPSVVRAAWLRQHPKTWRAHLVISSALGLSPAATSSTLLASAGTGTSSDIMLDVGCAEYILYRTQGTKQDADGAGSGSLKNSVDFVGGRQRGTGASH